jgi:hypothetical protein
MDGYRIDDIGSDKLFKYWSGLDLYIAVICCA